MSNTFENTEKADKTQWHSNKEINPMVKSSSMDEDFIESNNRKSKKSRRNESDNENSSDKEQIFHPLDKIY